MLDKDLFVERILETENLTDELDDTLAEQLLDWGIDQLDAALYGIDTEETADEQVAALIACMRKINGIIGRLDSKKPEDLAVDLEELTHLKSRIGGARSIPGPANVISPAVLLHQMTPLQALDFLMSWGEPQSHSPSEPKSL